MRPSYSLGDCYWFTNDSKNSDDILWLALATANSDFIMKFYEYKFNNRLYSGRCRFMSQYVEQFPIPDPNKTNSKKIITLAKRGYQRTKDGKDTANLESQINGLVWEAFNVKSH